METLEALSALHHEALSSLHQHKRDDHDSDVERQKLTQHMRDFELLQHQVEELQNSKEDNCTPRQQLFEDGVLEHIQKQTIELTSLQVKLDQLDEAFSLAMESHHNNTNNVEEMKETVLQEMGDVKRELERCAMQTIGCQRGLQKLKAVVDAESFHRQVAKLVSNENLEC